MDKNRHRSLLEERIFLPRCKDWEGASPVKRVERVCVCVCVFNTLEKTFAEAWSGIAWSSE